MTLTTDLHLQDVAFTVPSDILFKWLHFLYDVFLCIEWDIYMNVDYATFCWTTIISSWIIKRKAGNARVHTSGTTFRAVPWAGVRDFEFPRGFLPHSSTRDLPCNFHKRDACSTLSQWNPSDREQRTMGRILSLYLSSLLNPVQWTCLVDRPYKYTQTEISLFTLVLCCSVMSSASWSSANTLFT